MEWDPTPIACCVCGASAATVWRVAKDHILGGDTMFTAVRCVRCGTARLNLRPSDMSRYYTPETYARAEEGGELARRLDAFFDRQAERALAALPNPTPGHLLDVGCGDGRFLRAMASRGWQVTGIETDPVAADLARRRANSDVIETPLEDADLPAESFDLISLLHVLEHVPNPRATLNTAYRLLRPGSILLLALPNAGSLEAEIFGASWYPLDLPRHFWGFSPRTLSRLTEECGFRRTRLRYLPLMFAPQSLRYLYRSIKGSANEGSTSKLRANETSKESGQKTSIFLRLLESSEGVGRKIPGEVMELTANKPYLPKGANK